MTAEQKIYWLKGYLEGKTSLNKQEIDVIISQLNTWSGTFTTPNPWTFPVDPTGPWNDPKILY